MKTNTLSGKKWTIKKCGCKWYKRGITTYKYYCDDHSPNPSPSVSDVRGKLEKPNKPIEDVRVSEQKELCYCHCHQTKQTQVLAKQLKLNKVMSCNHCSPQLLQECKWIGHCPHNHALSDCKYTADTCTCEALQVKERWEKEIDKWFGVAIVGEKEYLEKLKNFIRDLLLERDRVYKQSALERAAKDIAVKELIQLAVLEEREKVASDIQIVLGELDDKYKEKFDSDEVDGFAHSYAIVKSRLSKYLK